MAGTDDQLGESELIRLTLSAEGFTDVAAALDIAVADWSDDKKQRFVDGWAALQQAGAVMVETTKTGVKVSDDFTSHCRAFGVSL